jgi:alpha-tubulin suppressor-like RCC1 family protein
VAVGGYHTLAIKTSSELWSWGRNVCGRLGDGTTVSRCSPVREFCSATDWCQVSASWYSSTVAIRSKL